MRICTLKNCSQKHYAKGFCRSHYRQRSNEYKRRWLGIKSDPERHENHLAYMRKKSKEYHVDYRKNSDVVYFDGNREKAIKRDKEKCSLCGLTRKEHIDKYAKDLNVHHIDNNGFRRKKKVNRNSELSNLLTVCVSCHAKIHNEYTNS